MSIKHEIVKSSAIKSVGYDPETQMAEIRFKSGHTSQFQNISQEDYEALRDAPSVGQHFNKFWRNS